MKWTVTASSAFWATVRPFKDTYPRGEYLSIIRTIREAIAELEQEGRVIHTGWSDHRLTRSPFDDARSPFDDGSHFEFHIHDDDVLVVYFKRERNRRIRMVGVYSHSTIPRN